MSVILDNKIAGVEFNYKSLGRILPTAKLYLFMILQDEKMKA